MSIAARRVRQASITSTPITVANLLTVGDSAGTNPYTTGTVTPTTNGDPILLYVVNSATTGRTVSSVVGLGLTWTVAKQGAETSGTRAELWQGIGTASTGTVVITFSSTTTGNFHSFVQYTGAHKTVPVVVGQTAAATGNSTAPTVNLPGAITAGNAAVGGISVDVGSNPTAGTDFTRFGATYTVPSTGGAQ
jgi:hypothetical protein